MLLAGGTGLVGCAVAHRLVERDDVALASLVRQLRSSSERRIDFEALVADPIGTTRSLGLDQADVAISCLGTTIRSAGSQVAFRRVDHQYVLGFARAALHLGARQFILVSSVGAGGAGFYLSVKGETEEAVAALEFERMDIIRPGLLLGKRRERRIGERLGQIMAPMFATLLQGSLSRYGAIEANKVADAITCLVGATGSGRHVHHNPEIARWASSSVVGPHAGTL